MGRCKESLREEVTRAFKGSGSLDPLLALHEARPRGRAFSVRRHQTLTHSLPSFRDSRGAPHPEATFTLIAPSARQSHR